MNFPGEMNPLLHYVIELQHSGLEVRLVLNGIEIHRGTPEDKKIVQQKVNGWMRAEGNELTLYAGIADPEQIPNPINLKLLLFRGPHGRQPEESEALGRFAEREKSKLPLGAAQLVWKTAFPSDPFYGPWRWETARTIALDPTTIASVLSLIATIALALSRHEADRVTGLFRVFIDESSRAYGLDVGRLERQLQEMCAEWPENAPGKPVADDFFFFVEENRRLMRIERRDGLSVFSSPKAPGSGPVRIYVSSLQEGVTIVR